MAGYSLPSCPRLADRVMYFGGFKGEAYLADAPAADQWAALSSFTPAQGSRAPLVNWITLYHDNPVRAASEFERVRFSTVDPDADFNALVGAPAPGPVLIGPGATPPVTAPTTSVQVDPFQTDPATTTPSGTVPASTTPVVIIESERDTALPAVESNLAPMLLAALGAYLLIKG